MKQRIPILLLAAALILSACGQQPATTHTHSFSQEYASDATAHWHPCDCGEKGGYAEHKWDDGTVVKEPAAGVEGEMRYTCQICKATKTEPIAAEHVHSWDEGTVTVAPTVDSEGIKTFTCTVCGEEKTETVDKLGPDHTHKLDTTASDEHAHWQECICGEKDGVTAHTWDDGAVTTPAGQIEMGIKTFTCTGCQRKATEYIPAAEDNGLTFLQSTHYRMSDKLAVTPLTLEAEIYVDPSIAGRAGAIFSNYYGVRQDWDFEIYESGVPRFYYKDTAGQTRDYYFSDVDVRTGEFVHIAFTFDFANRTMSLYVDGKLAQTIACEADLASDITRYQFVVGGDNRSWNTNYFQGQLRSLAVYSDVRTAEEIALAAEKGTNLYADDLLVAYLLSDNNAGNDIIDLSGNDYIIQKEWLDSHEPTLDYAYSFAVVGDTQWLSLKTPEKMEGLYDWIIANKDSKKIAHVFGLGDITEEWNTAKKEQEWVRAYEYISKLDGVVPYSLVRGNHDESKYFLKYFANETYMSQFDGFMVEGDIRNSYKLVTIGSVDYLFLTLDVGASDEMLAWANELVLQYPDRRVIVTTHAYQGFDGGHGSYDNNADFKIHNDVDYSVGEKARDYNNGVAIWEDFVSKHPNIFLVMSGHTPLEDVFVLQTEGNHGNIVNQMLIDAQWMDPQKGGVGMVCMLYFSEDGRQMEVEWICTDTGKHYKEQNQFVLDLSDTLDVPPHDFGKSYDEECHYMACACGYIYGEEPHTFDGGTLNADGFMVYSCDCGYQRITSATDDPVAQALQVLFEKYYNSGVYYTEIAAQTVYFNGDKFWSVDANDYQLTADFLTLYDFVLGKHGDLRLDIGWNLYEGVYSSANTDTINGAKQLLGAKGDGFTKVTVEEGDYFLTIKLWADETVRSEAKIGCYSITTLVTHGGETLDVVYTKANEKGLCEITLSAVNGYVPEYDKVILSVNQDKLENTVVCSTVSVWDGTTVSTSLQGAGTKDDPFLIQSAADFAYLRNSGFSGQYLKLTVSIDLSGKAFFVDSFNGTLDGNHCSIRGINITNSTDDTGLFRVLGAGSNISNLSLYGKVSGAVRTGALAGSCDGRVENVVNYATVSGAGNLGGLIGNTTFNGNVKNCVNYGAVNGTSWNNGGIVGFAQSDVTDCVNFGNVTTKADCAGGVVGTSHFLVANCINYGTVSGQGNVGGVVFNSAGAVDSCINYGAVNSGWNVGGILANMASGKTATVTNCVNYGSITGTTCVAGIFGYTEATTIVVSGCVNYGAVTGTWGVGGIAGLIAGEVSDCVNNGVLNAKGQIGGIVGRCYGIVTGCTNNGKVIGVQDIIGGIVGHLYDAARADTINTTNEQKGTVEGANCKEMIGFIEQ